ncbi:MAG: Na+/H+ antiporter NhaA, partial [Lysobacterales bacterium]
MNENGNTTEHRGNAPLEKGFATIITPFQDFIKDQTTASVILIVCTVLAMVLANSPLAQWYESILHIKAGFVFSDWALQKSLQHWINDGLMAIFFFVLGLEIKREIFAGELEDPQQSLPVIMAAAGGMLFPALIYYLFNQTSPESLGWGIPMATDTAFAVGILALLGRRIPVAVFVFLTALAIIDDLGSILVIALFYTENINMPYLFAAVILLAFLLLSNLLGIRSPALYFLVGGLVWLAMLQSGVHATIAGILVAFTIPGHPERDQSWFLNRTRGLVHELETIKKNKQKSGPILAEQDQHEVVEQVERAATKTTTPLQRWEKGLGHPVALFVLPVFALANAGVPIDMTALPSALINGITAGIVFGLVFGKIFGIAFMFWLTLRLGWGRLPAGMSM